MKTYQEFLEKKGEAKWQKYWEEKKLFKTPEDVTPDNKYYILDMFPYPSGSGLHVGHVEGYAATDIMARYQKMKGKKVLHPMGWDAFGLPAENYAIKTGVHPDENTKKAVATFKEQMSSIGFTYDWDREINTSDPNYYKWTQWFFLLFYKRGLAYRKKQAVNWCDSCKTVLANDQVKEGHCERCDSLVAQKDMEQWYIKITEYADRLIEGLDKIDWPEETKKRQRDWIGRSSGASIKFKVKSRKDFELEVFTTRPDTLFGATYMVLAPEGEYVQDLKEDITNWKEVEKYIKATSKKTELDRQIDKEKTGVELKGIKAINPANNEEIPVWTADYVMASYGTGAIMAVPAHDERDFEFAKKFDLKRRIVVKPPSFQLPVMSSETKSAEQLLDEATEELNRERMNLMFQGIGKLINSDFLNDLNVDEAKTKMIEWLEEKGIGKGKIQYKLRDWSVSRQRFWGAPIPMLSQQVSNKQIKQNKFILVHGFTGSPRNNFFPWLKSELEQTGNEVFCPELPNSDKPNIEEQANTILDNTEITEDTVFVAHSLGGAVVMKLLEKIDKKVSRVIFVDAFTKPEFNDGARKEVEDSCDWKFDFEKIKENVQDFVVMGEEAFSVIPKKEIESMAKIFDARLIVTEPQEEHYCAEEEPAILDECFMSGLRPVPEEDLPVLLPEDVDFKPTGESPLNYSEEFKNRAKEKYGDEWQYEPDTLDTFMCSSWYYFRYLDPKNDGEFASPEALKKWMPVDFYLGGPEHVNGHLLYSRFFTKVLYDEGLIDFDEPFSTLRHQGLILGPDNRKMSKRWGNVINPTDVVNQYGADTCRMYEMFMGPLEDDKPWSENGVKGVRRFLDKVWKLQEKVESRKEKVESIEKLTHKTIKKVTEDLDTLGFNTAIARMMELVNMMNKEKELFLTPYSLLLKILAPFAPHMCEELWSELGNKGSVCEEVWPEYDEELIKDDEIKIVVQINGKLRGEMTVPADISEDDAKKQALEVENVIKWLDGKEPKKVIYVKGKLVSIVV